MKKLSTIEDLTKVQIKAFNKALEKEINQNLLINASECAQKIVDKFLKENMDSIYNKYIPIVKRLVEQQLDRELPSRIKNNFDIIF